MFKYIDNEIVAPKNGAKHKAPVVIAECMEFEGIRSRWMLVTPDIARVWLSNCNKQNREPNQTKISRLAKRMADGVWKASHQGIAFDKNGILIDGQNRLAAVVKSGVSIWFMISEGLEPLVRAVTDTGDSRRPADQLKILGNAEKPRVEAAVINRIRGAVYRDCDRLEWEQLEAERSKYRDGIAWATSKTEAHHRFDVAPVLGALVFAYKTEPLLIERSYSILGKGVGLLTGDPLLLLRDFILAEKRVGVHNRDDIFFKTLTALWHLHRGKRIGKLFSTEAALAFFKKAYGEQ